MPRQLIRKGLREERGAPMQGSGMQSGHSLSPAEGISAGGRVASTAKGKKSIRNNGAQTRATIRS